MSQIEATILGQGYVLAAPPGGEAKLRQAVAIVDREMSAIRDAGRVKARERIAVLTALNLAYQQVEREAAQPAASDRRAEAEPGTEPLPLMAAEGQPAPAALQGRIDTLVQRIDAALGDEGLLL